MASTNMVIVFSGFRPSDELKKQIEEKMNAKVQTALSKNTTHLVLKITNKGSKKIEEAEEMGIQIVDLDKFMADNEFVVVKEKKTPKPKKDKALETVVEEEVKPVVEEIKAKVPDTVVEEVVEVEKPIVEEAPKKVIRIKIKSAVVKVDDVEQPIKMEGIEITPIEDVPVKTDDAPVEETKPVVEEVKKVIKRKRTTKKVDKKADDTAEEVKTEKKTRPATAYNTFMKETKPVIEKEHPEMNKKERHTLCLQMYNEQKVKK